MGGEWGEVNPSKLLLIVVSKNCWMSGKQSDIFLFLHETNVVNTR